MPRNLVDAARNDGREAWLASVPATVEEIQRRWSLRLDDPFQPGGQTAWVAPGRDASGVDVVLKVAWRHPEAEHEADGLRRWNGNGAVQLHAAIELEDSVVLLLERCTPGVALASRPEREQDQVIAGLFHRLWLDVEAGHPFRSLQLMCDAWADEFEQKTSSRPLRLDPGLSREGIALFRSLPATAERHVLLCTDLHAGNVLAAGREPWLAIDPKPYIGDPTYDPVQHILNCGGRLRADPRGLVQRIADLLGLDPNRLLLWLFARCVQASCDWPGLADIARRIPPT